GFQRLRLDHRDAARIALAGVRLQHRGREVLHDAVLHDLHRRGPDASPGVFLAQRPETVYLPGVALAVPPLRPHYPEAQLAALVERAIRLEVLFVDVRILD